MCTVAALLLPFGAFKDRLGLDLTPRYHSQWITVQWSSWKTWLVGRLGLPAAHFLPSTKAAPGEPDPRKALPEFAVSSPALLGLLLRWSTTLKGAGPQTSARELFAGLVEPLVCQAQGTWHAEWAMAPDLHPFRGKAPNAVPVSMANGHVLIGPLASHLSFMRRQAFTKHCVLAEGGGMAMKVVDFAVALQADGSEPARALLAHFLCWLSRLVDEAVPTTSSVDPLDAPVPQGRQRARRLHKELKQGVVDLILETKVAKSGGHALRIVKRFKHMTRNLCSSGFNRADQAEAMAILAAASAHFKEHDEPFVSLAWDATRISGRETLWTACCSPSSNHAAWAPPQVWPSVLLRFVLPILSLWGARKAKTLSPHSADLRRFFPIFTDSRRLSPIPAGSGFFGAPQTSKYFCRFARNFCEFPSALPTLGLAEVMRELALGGRTPGSQRTQAAWGHWTQKVWDLFHSGSDRAGVDPKGKKQRRTGGGPAALLRHTAGDYFVALDHILHLVYGKSLATFCPPPDQPAPPQPLSQRPTLVMWQDEGSPGFALSWYLLFHCKARYLPIRDPLHREWNDLKGALRQAGVWWVVLWTSIVYNLNYGPWEGQGWWQKQVEAGEEYLAKAGPQDPLLEQLYPAICADRGIEAVGTPEHKEALLEELLASSLFQRKGPRVALRRWFSWNLAATSHDRTWHLRLLTIMGLGIEVGEYTSKADLPIFPTEPPDAPAPTAHQVQAEAQTTPSTASSSTAAPAVQAKEAVQREDREVKDLRAKAKNTLLLAGQILATEGLQELTRLILALSKPLFDRHSEAAAALRSRQATRSWHLAAATGQWVQDLWAVASTLQDTQGALSKVGFATSLDQATARALKTTHPLVLRDDLLAERAWAIMLGILSHRSRSMVWHSHTYPGSFALLLSPDPEILQTFLATLQKDWAAWLKLQGQASQSPFWKSALRASPFQTTLVQEWATRLLDPNRTKEEVLAEGAEAASLLFGGWGQTKVVEDNFHCLRSGEQLHTGTKVLRSRRQVLVASTARTLEQHGRAEVSKAAAGIPVDKLPPTCFTPAKHSPSMSCQDLTHAATWPSYSPQSASGLVALLQLARTCDAQEAWQDGPGVWRACLVPAGTVFTKKGQGTWALSLGSVGDVAVLSWPLHCGEAEGRQVFSLVAPGPGGLASFLQWTFIFDQCDFEALPTAPLSPVHMFLLQGKGALHKGICLVATGQATGLLQFGAHHAFWSMSLTQIIKIMRAEGLVPAKGTSLYEALKALIQHCLPQVSPSTLAGILSQRALKQGGPSVADLPAEMLEDVFPDGLESKAAKALTSACLFVCLLACVCSVVLLFLCLELLKPVNLGLVQINMTACILIQQYSYAYYYLCRMHSCQGRAPQQGG